MADQAIPLKDFRVWGQFLDQGRNERQYGIYGTSAAVQTLCLLGSSPDSPAIRASEGALATTREQQVRPVFAVTDLENSFKVAYLLDSVKPTETAVDNFGALETRLINDIADTDGWGNCRTDDRPRLMPTAQLLLSLSRSQAFRRSVTAARVVNSLSRRLTDDDSLSVLENAMAYLALHASLTADPPTEDVRGRALRIVSRRLISATENPECARLDTVSVHYTMKEGTADRHHYMFYLRAALLARALLRMDGSKHKYFVTQVTEALCANIELNGGFRSPTTNRLSTVDQLEAVRLLVEFKAAATGASHTLLPTAARIIDGSVRRRALTTTGLSLVGGGGGYATFESATPAIQASGGAVAAVALGVLAAAIWGWTGTDSDRV